MKPSCLSPDKKASGDTAESKAEAKVEAAARKPQSERRVEPSLEPAEMEVKKEVKEVRQPGDPGELGKPVKIEKPDKETKAAIDKGWQVLGRYCTVHGTFHLSTPVPLEFSAELTILNAEF